jgi:hypothetical protein
LSAQDLGTLADYVLNGDNYQRVLPDGSTLVIPGQQGRPPLSPTSVKDTYRPLNGDCASGTCALIVHDVFTGFYYIEGIATFDPQIETCICALAGSFESPNCVAQVQAQVDSLAGKILFETVPLWLIEELGVPLDALFAPDFWFIACYGDTIVIPNLVSPIPASCPAGTAIDALGVCKAYDPPVPFPLKDITSMVPRTPPPTTKPQKIFLPNPNPIELSGVAPWPLPQVIMAPECTKCMTGEDGEEEAI